MNTSSAARPVVTCAPLLTLLIAVLPAFAAAQEPVRSFDQLKTRLKVGDTIYVTDVQGREVRGRVRELGPSALTLDSGGPTTMHGDAVRVIEKRSSSPVKRGALWGLAAGAGLGVTWLAIAAQDPGDGSAGIAVAILGGCAGIGAGLGAAIGAAVPEKRVVIYRAVGASGSARFSLTPVITPRTKGVAVAFTF